MTIDYDSVLDGMDSMEDKCDKETGEVVENHISQQGKKVETDIGFTMPKNGISASCKPIMISVKDNVFNLALAKSKMDSGNIDELVAKAKTIIIETDEDTKYGLSVSMQARKMSNSIEKARKEIVRPALDFQKAVKKYADEFTNCLKDIETSITKKIGIYNKKKEDILRKEFEAKQKIERERIAKENERIAKENALKREQAIKENKKAEEVKEVIVPEKEVFVPPPQKIATDDGSMVTVTEWVYRIKDESKIPREYLLLDTKKIKEHIKCGIRLIDGIEIYEERKEKFRVRK